MEPNKIVQLDQRLLNKIKFCTKTIETTKKKLLKEMTPIMESLEEARTKLEEHNFTWEQTYCKPLDKVKPEERNPEEFKECSKLTHEMRLIERKLIDLDKRSSLAKELIGYRELKDQYEDQVCKLANVLPRYVNWDNGTAEFPADSPTCQDLEKELNSELKAISR